MSKKKWSPRTWENEEKIDLSSIIFGLTIVIITIAALYNLIVWSQS